MLVCICKGVSDRRINEEIRRGACTLRQIQEGCQAGTDCKSCVRQIRQMLSTQAHSRQDPTDVG
jgi:bacterioferritin-associated ferredoxin